MSTAEIKVLIVEDEPLFASKVEMQIDKLGYTCVGVADDSAGALKLAQEHEVSLVLMDINITGDYDGIEVADMIKSIRDVPIVYVTSNHDDQSFNRASRSGAEGFVLKPFTNLQLQRAIQLAVKQYEIKLLAQASSQDADVRDGIVFVRKLNEIKRVDVDDIFYLEADGRHCRLYTSGEMFLIRCPLKEMMTRLNKDDFLQCHRSYVVNIKKIKSIDVKDDLVILEARSIPLSRREKDNVLTKLDYLS